MTAYEFLGISRDATDDEIKRAYKRKSQQIAQSMSDASLSDIAKKKMEMLDKAYDEIMMSRINAGNRHYDGEYAYAPSDNETSSSSSSEGSSVFFGDIRAKIAAGRLDDAEMLLDGTPDSRRNAEWYYLKGKIQHKRGWLDEASRNFGIAYSMNQSNDEYKKAYEQCERNRKGKYGDQTFNSGCCTCAPCSICGTFMLADLCCKGSSLCFSDGSNNDKKR